MFLTYVKIFVEIKLIIVNLENTFADWQNELERVDNHGLCNNPLSNYKKVFRKS